MREGLGIIGSVVNMNPVWITWENIETKNNGINIGAVIIINYLLMLTDRAIIVDMLLAQQY